MKGQWFGRTTGDQSGRIVINIDDRGDYFSGVAVTIPDDVKFPWSAAFLKTENKNSKFSFRANTVPVNPNTGLPCQWNEIQQRYPGLTHSTYADISGDYGIGTLSLRATTDLGTKIEANITQNPHSTDSIVEGQRMSWQQYKQHVSTLSKKEYLYRGQQKPWKLRTSFHRRGRYDLSRFVAEDIPRLYKRLMARTKHVFNITIPDENGAFINLAQNHGYPTPLLDWTYSPYVAAFFAFRNVPKKNTSSDSDRVRIFIFDQESWKTKLNQLMLVNAASPHLSILEFLAIDNERLVPQQGITTLTNIDDIEDYIHTREDEGQCTYLSAIDILATEREDVIKELYHMGITAGSMFPGLDGSCEELREKYFDE